MKISFSQALYVAKEMVECLSADAQLRLVLVEEYTKETRKGWVFFYDSEQHLESGKPSDAIVGNCPIYVSVSGAVELLPTYQPVEKSILEIESRSEEG